MQKRGTSSLVVLKDRKYSLNTKGISPLIATILIIGFAVILAVIVFTWGSGFMRMLTEETGEKASQDVYTVQNVRLKINHAISKGNDVDVTISNIGNINVKARVNLIEGGTVNDAGEIIINAAEVGIHSSNIGGCDKVLVIPIETEGIKISGLIFERICVKDKSMVIRGFSSTSINPDDSVNITLSVYVINNEENYTIVENVPSGWVITDNGGGSVFGSTITWDVPSGAQNIVYTYTVTAPSQTGIYSFNGTYIFGGFPSPITTKGQTDVTVGGRCVEDLNGYICSGTEYCPGTELPALDTSSCCSVPCEEATCTTCDTCGAGLFNICDRAECYACTSDNCYFIDNLILPDDCYSCTGAVCENYLDDQTTCSYDPCGLGSCLWDGSQCFTQTESTVIRGFSSTSVNQGDSVDVTLGVYIVGGEDYYAIEEYIPIGWNVTDAGGGGTPDPNVLKWAVIENASIIGDVNYIYTVTAPFSASTYIFDGIYMLEGFNNSISTGGQTTVTVT